MNKKYTEKEEVAIQLLAKAMHQANTDITEKQWYDHIKATEHDPKLFFGDVKGVQQYETFKDKFDADKHRLKKLKEQYKMKGRV